MAVTNAYLALRLLDITVGLTRDSRQLDALESGLDFQQCSRTACDEIAIKFVRQITAKLPRRPRNIALRAGSGLLWLPVCWRRSKRQTRGIVKNLLLLRRELAETAGL